MTSTYATTIQLARYLNIEGTIPDRTITSADRIKELVGTGDDSETRFFLDYAYVIAGSYTISYGTSESSVTALTETTHYTLDKDKGEITLTSAGVTAVSTNKIYAAYSYCIVEVTDTELQAALDRAQDEIDRTTNNHWATGTDTTPDYTQVTNEKHTGKGKYDRDYYLNNYPLPDVSTALDGDVAADDATITVDSTNGFPSSGYLLVKDDKIQYTGKTSTTFTGCTSVSAHDDNDAVYPYVVEISTTDSGTTPSWTILQKDADFDIDLETGKVHVYRTDYDLIYYNLQYPPRLIPNRFRTTYFYGNETIPDAIKRLTLMIAARDIMHTTVKQAQVSNDGNFDVSNVNVDDDWIEKTMQHFTNIQVSNI